MTRHSLPGQVFILFPDERHDGRAGDERGFGYRIAYIDPALIREAAATKTLPFIRDPVSADRRLRRAVVDLVGQQGDPADDLMTTCNLVALADALVYAARDNSAARSHVEARDIGRIREVLQAKLDKKIRIDELETVSGLTRWQLARQFRKSFGVSPYRFHVLRRLDRARELLIRGQSLAEVAQSTGFADQAHLTRQFRSAYGLSPGQWRALLTCVNDGDAVRLPPLVDHR
jgi:AraC-like DNA-binding protein